MPAPPWLRHVFVVMVGVTGSAVATTGTAYGHGDVGAKLRTSLSVGELVEAFRRKAGLQSLAQGAKDRALRETEARSMRFASAPRLGIESEVTSGGDRSERAMTVRVGQTIVSGVDDALVKERYSALAESELLERASALVDEEKGLVLTFVAARQELVVHAALEQARAEVAGLAARADRAAQVGAVGGMLATRAKLLLDELATQVEQSHVTYGARARQLMGASGLPSSEELGAILFEDLPASFLDLGPPADKDALPALRSLELERRALAVESDELRSRRELEISAGVGRSWGESTETRLTLDLTVPLGVGAAARSEAMALDAKRAVLGARAEMMRQRLERADMKARSEVDRLRGIALSTGKTVRRLEDMRVKVGHAFDRGQAELSEVLEVTRELVDARVEAARQRGAYEEALVERHYLFVTRDP